MNTYIHLKRSLVAAILMAMAWTIGPLSANAVPDDHGVDRSIVQDKVQADKDGSQQSSAGMTQSGNKASELRIKRSRHSIVEVKTSSKPRNYFVSN